MFPKSYYFERITQRFSYPAHFLATTSPRKVLLGINFLLAVFSFCICAVSIYLCRLLYDPNFISGWFNWFGLSVVGFSIGIVAILGMRGAHVVSLDLLLAYFWSIVVLIAPLVLGLFSCVNFLFYSQIWIRYSWTLTNFEPIRALFCEPSSTADTKCVVPFSDFINFNGSTSYNTTEWCIEKYAALDCEQIRDNAVAHAIDWYRTLIVTQSFVGVAELLIIGWSMYSAYQILTSPVITQSMLDVINFILAIPIAGCAIMASYFWPIRFLDLRFNWLPVLYVCLAVAQVLALPMGIVAGRLKSRMLLRCYMCLMALICLSFGVAAGIGWTLAGIVNVAYNPSSATLGDLACDRGLPNCSDCSGSERSCPQWSKKDILTLVSLDLRLAGIAAVICILYILGGFIVAWLFDQSLKNYKSDFI